MQAWQVFFEIPGKPPVELREGESIIGRSRTSAVHIPETTVSRQHARVQVGAAGHVAVSDLGSSNGTFVNGEKVEGERKLADGDRVLIGDAELIIRILAPEPVDATVRVSIPPMSAPPAVAATVRMDAVVPAPSAPAAGPGAATIAAPLDLPMAPMAPMAPVAPVAPVAPAPPPTPMTPATPMAPPAPPRPAPPVAAPAPPPPPAPRPPVAPPPPPISAPVVLPPSPAPAGGGDVLSAIDFDKLGAAPGGAAAKRPAASAAPAPAGATAPGGAAGARYAGFWIRVVAYLIDMAPMLVLAGVAFALSIFVDPTVGLLVNLLVLPYWFFVALFLPATQGTSLGKKMMGLAIVTDTTRPGQGLGWGKAFLRLLGYFVSSLAFSIGYLLVAFTSKKQGLHDLIAGTYVVRTR